MAAATGNYTVKAEDNAGNVATLLVAVDPTPRATGLQLVGHVNAPSGLTLPASAPVAAPIGVKAGYQMTFAVAVAAADTVKIRLHSCGQPVLMQTMVGASYVLEQPTGSRAPTTVYYAFWLDPTTPKGTVLSMEITAIRNGTPIKTTVDSALGHDLMVIVGSSLIDGGVNQIR